MNEIINYLVRIHTSAHWTALIQLYGFAGGLLLLAVLLYLHSRAKATAEHAQIRAGELSRQVRDLQSSLERMESSISKEVESSVARKMDARIDSTEKRMQKLHERQSEALDERAADLSTRISEMEAELRAFDRHLEKVEKRMPSVFDRLEDFQRALTKGYQTELSSVFESFDNAVGAVLDQMKNELKTGLSRIEGIEGMVDKRRKAEQEFGLTEETAELPEGIAPESGEFSGFGEGEEEPASEQSGTEKAWPGGTELEEAEETEVSGGDMEREEEMPLSRSEDAEVNDDPEETSGLETA